METPAAGFGDPVPPAQTTGKPPETATPLVPRSRITGVDAARGVALVGMIAVHTFPLVNDAGEPALAWSLFSGKAAALFAMLAGVGLAFASGGPRPSPDGWVRGGAAVGLVARAGVIAVIGLAVGSFTEDPYVILPYYGVMFLLAVPFLFSPTRVLVFVAVLCALVSPFVMQALRPDLPFPFVTNPSLVDVVAHPWRLASSLLLTGVYPAVPWMTYVCVGLVIGRRNLRDLRVARWLVGLGLVLAVVPAAVSRILLERFGGYEALLASPRMTRESVADVLGWGPDPVLPTTTNWWLAIAAPHSSTPVDLVHTTGIAMTVLGCVLLLERVRGVVTLLSPLAAAGSLTLTLYTLNVLLIGSGAWEDHPAELFLGQLVAVLVGATWWRRVQGQGPLERLVTTSSHRARDVVLRRAERARSMA